MTSPNEFQDYLGGNSSTASPLFVEIPPPLPPVIEKTPTGFSPMERIELEGQAYRGLASGHIPWWVMISGWVIFGLPCVAALIMAVVMGELGILGVVAPFIVIFWIMWRGTQAKLAYDKEQAQRKAKYQRLANDND